MSESVNGRMGNTHSLTNTSTHLPKTPIIQVKHLSKRYQIGMDRTYKTFCESAVDTLKSPLKRLKSFSRQEETFWALKDINFEVYPGEVVGIIGRNGAGKSTLLKILSRITHPTEGEIILRGRVASLLEVGTGFHPELTGRENVYFNGAILGMTKQEIEDKFDEIVEFSGVADFLDTPLKRYSSGMQVRLAFAVAAHLEPEILVVDEVLAVGDAAFQKKCLGKMDEVAKGGRTVLFVSHNMAAIENLCQNCILLDKGKIIKNGQTQIVIEYYLSTLKESSPILLRDRKDRQGDGQLRFTDTWVEDATGQRVSRVRSGASMKIVVLYEVKKGEGISNLVVGFAINTIRNIAITDLSNANTGDYFKGKIPKKGRVECFIPKLPLNTGIYFYNVIARSGNGIEDWVQQAGRFDVETGDFFGTGKIPDSGRLIMIDHTWSFLKQGIG